tara:strand:- start:274 stop:1332 length:1059 start_codon:yes stop_codon:yes gene_type:complete
VNQKILHICGLDKFIPPFINLIDENFDLNKHHFWLNGNHDNFKVYQSTNIYKVKKGVASKVKGYLKLLSLFKVSDKIILHGLLDPRIVIILFFMPWQLYKCHWAIWGADLYTYKLSKRNLKWRIKEFFRQRVIREIGHILTYIPGDVELARKWYGAKGIHHECLMYQSNIIDQNIILPSAKIDVYNDLNILIGNSADVSNNHIDSLKMLLPYKNHDIKIFAPLSYGDKIYAKMISDKGREWFGEKFTSITTFMEYEDYIKFLKKIDIAIFNHKRQQAMGNIISLLGLGKKVFLRNSSSHYNYLKSLGCHLFDISKLNFERLDGEQAKCNFEIVANHFSKKKLVEQLSCIFED